MKDSPDLSQGGRAAKLSSLTVDEMVFLLEMVVKRCADRDELLQ